MNFVVVVIIVGVVVIIILINGGGAVYSGIVITLGTAKDSSIRVGIVLVDNVVITVVIVRNCKLDE